MLFRLFPYLAITLCIAGCASTEADPPEHPDVARARDEITRMRELEERCRAEFQEKYKQYVCRETDVPDMQEASGPGDQFKSMQFGDHLVVKLKLGDAIRADGSLYGPTRTKSRYQLYWDSKRVAEAESLFSLPLLDDESDQSRFFYNPADHTLVVLDDLCWSTQRFCVFERVIKPGSETQWAVKYFWVPDKPSSQPLPEMGRVVGVGNGNIYMLLNCNYYAFPFRDFLVQKLEFTIG
jgi:hypothetical protein